MSDKPIFRRGDRVTVRLTEDHQLGGDQAHAAKFIAYHAANRDWAEVELEEEHAGGTHALHVPLSAIEPAEESDAT